MNVDKMRRQLERNTELPVMRKQMAEVVAELRAADAAGEISNKDAMHFWMIALPGSQKHLREVHGVEPSDDKLERTKQHFAAHDVAEDARRPPGSHF